MYDEEEHNTQGEVIRDLTEHIVELELKVEVYEAALRDLKEYGGCFCDYVNSQHTDYPDKKHTELCERLSAMLGEPKTETPK